MAARSYFVHDNAVGEVRTLANRLAQHSEHLNEVMKQLSGTYTYYEGNLGVYGEYLEEVLQELQYMSLEQSGAIQNLRYRLQEFANEIEKIIAEANIEEERELQYEKMDLSHGTPRKLRDTQLKWEKGEAGSMVYGEPEKLIPSLSRDQGVVENFEGTCGLICCENILKMSGIHIRQEEMIDYAKGHCIYYTDGSSKPDPLCTSNSFDPYQNGETNYKDRRRILEHFGVHTEAMPQEIHDIARAVTEGRGVILSVHSNTLYRDEKGTRNDFHAVNVVGVKTDSNGSLEGFYICDPAAERYKNSIGIDLPVYYPADRIQRSLSEKPCLVTQDIIR